MRFLLSIIVYFVADLILQSVAPPDTYAYLSIIIGFGLSVSMMMSVRPDDRDFGILIIGSLLYQLQSHFEMSYLGKDKTLEQINKSWVETNYKVWIVIGVLGILTYGMKNLFRPKN